jgi:C4-dicarboxylate transporter DctQ subunit
MINRVFERFEEGAIALLLFVMTVLTFVQAVLRYGFNSGLTWALEATGYMFGWLIFLGISYGIKKGSHIVVDVLVKKLPVGGQRIVGMIVVLLCIVYTALMLYGAWRYVSTMQILGVTAEDIPVPRWILLLAIPLGLFMVLVRLSESAWLVLSGRLTGMKLADEAKEAIEQFAPAPHAPSGTDR